MTSYVKTDPQPVIAERSAADLVKTYSASGIINGNCPYNQIAPGLYPDEVGNILDVSGEMVALSVERIWQPNGEGVSYNGYARVINADGSTKLSPEGKPMEISYGHDASIAQFNTHGDTLLAREVALVLLGEDPELLDGIYPLISMPDAVRESVNIATQIAAAATGSNISLSL